MDVGIVILCPDRNVAGLRNTLGSVKHHTYDRESICVVDDAIPTEALREFKQFCETHKGDNTITSLINTGMKKVKHDWAFLVFGGSRIQPNVEHKFSQWVKKDTDILFPVVDMKWNFVDGSFNGVLINKKFFADVGDFPSQTMQKSGLNDFEFAKMLWSIDAIEKGCTFKAIVGMRII